MKADCKLIVYKTERGEEPLNEWLRSYAKRDKSVYIRIRREVKKLATSGLGDRKSVEGADGLYELRMHFGPGYRVYYIEESNEIILLFFGGEKKSQTRDIEKAKKYLDDYMGVHYERSYQEF